MKHVSGMKKTVLAATVAATAATGLIAPSMAAAEVSGNVGISNIYLWRGQDLSAGNAQVFGGLDYAHSTGLYAGVWASSENDTDDDDDASTGGMEYDLYAGYGGAVGDFSYDLSFVDYNYPNATDADFQEVIASFGLAGFSAAAFIGVGDYGHGSDAVDNKDNYYNVGYSYDQFGVNVGYFDFDADSSDYTHVDLTYAMTDELGFTVSKVVDSDDDNMDEANDTLFVVTYALSF